MTRQSSKSPARRAGPPAGRAKSPDLPVLRWWNKMTKIILGAGALATAIAAILALLPSRDQQNIARFTSVEALSHIPLSEYQQRSVTFKGKLADQYLRQAPGIVTATTDTLALSRRAETAAAGEPSPSPAVMVPPTATASFSVAPSSTATAPAGASASASVSAPGSPSADSSPAASASADPSPTATASPAGGLRTLLPPGLSLSRALGYTSQVLGLVRQASPVSFPCGQLTRCAVRIVLTTSTDAQGNLVPPGVAARRLVGLLGHTQTVSWPSGRQTGGPRHKREPLGELVSANVELAGFRGRTVFLSWSIFQKDNQDSLFGKWLSDFVAYRLQATTNDDTGTLEMWIPLPRAPGPYFVRLNLSTAGASLASMDSNLFS